MNLSTAQTQPTREKAPSYRRQAVVKLQKEYGAQRTSPSPLVTDDMVAAMFLLDDTVKADIFLKLEEGTVRDEGLSRKILIWREKNTTGYREVNSDMYGLV